MDENKFSTVTDPWNTYNQHPAELEQEKHIPYKMHNIPCSSIQNRPGAKIKERGGLAMLLAELKLHVASPQNRLYVFPTFFLK